MLPGPFHRPQQVPASLPGQWEGNRIGTGEKPNHPGGFLYNREGRPGQLVVLGAAITKNAAARYGITVSAVYWQVNGQIQGFETSRPDAQHSGGGAAAPGLPLPHRKHDHPTAEEFAAFEAARQKGHELQLGNRVYLSDLAPLGGGPERGDSQR